MKSSLKVIGLILAIAFGSLLGIGHELLVALSGKVGIWIAGGGVVAAILACILLIDTIVRKPKTS